MNTPLQNGQILVDRACDRTLRVDTSCMLFAIELKEELLVHFHHSLEV